MGGRLRNLPTRQDLRAFLSSLRSADRTSTLRATFDGLVVTLVLRRRGLRPLVTTPPEGLRWDAVRAAQVTVAVDAGLAMLPLAATCLRRSLVLLRELRRLGLAGTLQLGVRQHGARTEAHAWVEVGGEIVNDDPATVGTYQPFASGDVERLLPLLP